MNKKARFKNKNMKIYNKNNRYRICYKKKKV